MKQLTKNQIQELFAFTKSHRVRYYDLQSEVVDHLASAIENKWEENPEIPFQKALEEVYAGFGIYGFGKLEQEKREAIQRKIGWKIWAFIKSYLTPPKILITLLFILATYQGLNLLDKPIRICHFLVYFFIFAFLGLVEYKKLKIRPLMEKYLEVNAVYKGAFPVLLMSEIAVDILVIDSNYSDWIIWALATWLVISFLAAVGVYNYLMDTVEEVKLRYE